MGSPGNNGIGSVNVYFDVSYNEWGGKSSVGRVSFAAAIVEAPELAFLGAGALAMGVVRRRRSRG